MVMEMERGVARLVDACEAFHPGAVLREAFVHPLGIKVDGLAALTGLPVEALTELLAERRAVGPAEAEGLADALGTTPAFWLALQARYEDALAAASYY